MPVPGSNSSPEGSFFVYPTLGGGTNFQSPSYSPLTGWFYLAYSEGGAAVRQRAAGAGDGPAVHRQRPGRGAPPARGPNDPAPNAGIKAIDPETGKTMWDFKMFAGLADQRRAGDGGRRAVRVDRATATSSRSTRRPGKHLWHFQTGGNHAASPISYAVDGRQYVALTAGNVLYSFALPE